jgi:fatty-acyl-CoA synthase
LNGAEPVDPGTIEAFCGAAEPHGFRAEAAFPAFGMAEVAIAGTFPEPGSGLRVDVVDRRLLETERYAAPVMSGPQGRAFDRAPARPARLDRLARLARLGRPVAGLEVRICDPQTGSGLDDREVGELQIRGTSVTPGYYNQPGATAEAFMEGWLRTGDLAYLAEGELVVCGRLKDMIIVGGRNVFPEDVERAVASIEGIRAGNVIAFGIEGRKGREVVVVVAETREEDHRPIRQAVSVRVLEAVGVPAEEIVLVPPGTLPKTSSGKLQRSLCRTRYLDAQLHPVS